MSQPTFVGHLETADDAAIICAACIYGVLKSIPSRIPNVQDYIKAGHCYVFIDGKTSIRRWTDGKIWSSSRVSGSFMTYRELEVVERNPTERMTRIKNKGLLKKSISLEIDGKKCHVVAYSGIATDTFVRPTQSPGLNQFKVPFKLAANSTTPGVRKTGPCKRKRSGSESTSIEELSTLPESSCTELTRFPGSYFIILQ